MQFYQEFERTTQYILVSNNNQNENMQMCFQAMTATHLSHHRLINDDRWIL